jgi:hypothetical protein
MNFLLIKKKKKKKQNVPSRRGSGGGKLASCGVVVNLSGENSDITCTERSFQAKFRFRAAFLTVLNFNCAFELITRENAD